jgi:hypothetical protein
VCQSVVIAREANPTIRTFLRLSAMDVAKSCKILSYIRKAYLLYISSKFVDKSRRKEIWKREALEYFEDDNDEGIDFLM